MIGLRATSFLAPLGALLAAAILYWSPVRHLRDLPVMDSRTPAQVAYEVERGRAGRRLSRGRLAEERLDERLGVERQQVVDALAHAHEPDGHLEASSIANTMPPLAVESSLVRTMPVRPTASWKALAWASPFWPVVASRTNRVSGSAPGSACR